MKPKYGLFAGIVLVVLAAGVYLVFGGGDAPAELTLGERGIQQGAREDVEKGAEPVIDLPTAKMSNVVGCNTPPLLAKAANSVADVEVDHLRVVEGSIAGYRVVEDFIGGLANVDAVGRTTAVQGDLWTMSGGWRPVDDDTPATTTAPPNPELMAAWICVDVASIKSDKGSRDNRFRTAIMDTANFPVATFVTALDVPSYQDTDIPAGEAATFSVPGRLTMVGKEVDVRASVTIQRAEAPHSYELVAQIPVVCSDFGIDNPSNAIVSVRDEGMIEVSLAFARAPR